mmetsp:Transcript_22995/g.65173  ORF Transcript_22995/g.65173 Transcript_22995/m.65173 type:complete len:331 (+) Transcript_22995:480-1472(+)
MFALNFGGMCCSAAPFRRATCIMNAWSFRSKVAAHLTACPSFTAHCAMKDRSSRKSSMANIRADPLPLSQAPSRSSLSRRSASSAPWRASPRSARALATKARSALRESSAYANVFAVSWTACRTSFLSFFSSGPANSSARPRLASTAAHSSARSPETSGGALASCVQSVRTMARQLASLKLSSVAAAGPGMSPEFGDRTPALSAAWQTPFSTSAMPPSSDPSTPCFTRAAAKDLVRRSFSDAGRSLERWKSWRRRCGPLPWTSSEALAAVRKRRLGMSITLAATMSSNIISLSTLLTKCASHLDAPESTRLSLTSGVRISEGGNSAWYLK